MDDAALKERIRRRAHDIWVEEGRPEGRSKEHWELARLAVAEEDGQHAARRKPEPPQPEPIEAVENQGEFPTMTDQGEEQIPHRSTKSDRPPEPTPPLERERKSGKDPGPWPPSD